MAAENIVSEFDYKAKTQNSEVQTEEAPRAVDAVYAELKISLERYRLLEIIAISVAVAPTGLSRRQLGKIGASGRWITYRTDT
jgi:hypothetical protein